MAHNPPVPARLHIADRIGLLVIDENHFYGEHGRPCKSQHFNCMNHAIGLFFNASNTSERTPAHVPIICHSRFLQIDGVYNPETKLESQRDLAELVLRDRNHPSVWVWNLCNGNHVCSGMKRISGVVSRSATTL